jgi:hypothetical protein
MSQRIALVAAGAVLTAVGGILALGGGTVVAVTGTDGTFSSGHETISSTTRALVSDHGDIDEGGIGVAADPSIEIAVRGSDKPVFVGVGPTAAVDRYLAGASVETITDFDVRPFELTTTVRDGSGRLGPPADESFWVAEAGGRSAADATWKIRDGSYRIVVMNADGSPGISVDGAFGVHVPRLTAIATTALAGGLILVVSGIVLVVAGARSTDRPAPQESASPYVTVRI